MMPNYIIEAFYSQFYTPSLHNYDLVFEDIAKIFQVFPKIWHYTLFTMDGQPVAISNLLSAIIFMILGLKIAKYLSDLIYSKLLRVIKLDITVTNLLGKIFHYLFIIIVTIIVLNIAHFPLTAFTFIGGALAVSVGVGGQHVVNNFISGIVLMIENPIKVGDLIEVHDIIGRVVSIDARSVNILTTENKNVFVPHSIILQNEVINWTFDDSKVMLTTKIKLLQEEININEVRDLILNVISQNHDIFISPKPQVLLLNFDYNLLEFEINFWVNLAYVNRKEVISSLNISISNALKNNKINLAVAERRVTKKLT